MDDRTTRVEEIPVGLERQGTIPRPARRKKRIVTVVAVAAVAICGSPTFSTVAEMASYWTCRACVYTALQVLLTRPAPPMCFAKVRRWISQPVMTYRTFLSGFFFSAMASTAACRSECANGVEIHVWEKVCPLVPPSSKA
jgi:hypothetical protein